MSFIRERPSLRLNATITTPTSTVYRWGSDEDLPANTPRDLTFSTTMPGGFDQCSLTLPRKSGIDYSDLAEFSTASILGLGGSATAWQGRLERTPRVSGDQMVVSPGLVGWQAHLDDNKTAKAIYIDIDQTRWTAPSNQRQTALRAATIDVDGPNTDRSAVTPILKTTITSPWSRYHTAEAWYDAKAIPIAGLYTSWSVTGEMVAGGDPHWHWSCYLCSDDVATAFDSPGDLRAAGPGMAAQSASAADRTFALLSSGYDIAYAGTSNIAYSVNWTYLAVVGLGITIRGTQTATGGLGVYASDVVAAAITRFAPSLALTQAGTSTITGTGFLIPHLAFLDPTTAGEIIAQANKYELYDWAVWEGPTFWYYPRGSQGRSWRARVGPAKLSEAGPQVDKIWNGVIVTYSDPGGISRTAGPPGSGAELEDTRLLDTDPLSPANAIENLKRWAGLQMGVVGKDPTTGKPEAALRIGQMFLAQQKALNTSGDATLVGHVEDDRGVLWPAWMVRAGDTITFVDAHDTTPRRVVKTEYSDASKSCQVSLDSPPESLQAYLDRVSVSLQPFGFT